MLNFQHFFLISIVLIFFVYTSYAQNPLDITANQLTPTTASLSWTSLTSNNRPYELRNFGNTYLTTFDTKTIIYFSPNINYSFVVCRNNTNDQETCSDAPVTFDTFSDVTSFPNAFSIDSENVAFVFDSSFVLQDTVVAKDYVVETLTMGPAGGVWAPVFVERALPNENVDTVYSVVFPVHAGVSRLYRISRFPFRTQSFWFSTQPRTYSGELNPVQVFSFTPSSAQSDDPLVLSPDSTFLLNFDLENFIPTTCIDQILSSRLVLTPQKSLSNLNAAGFLRVYDGDSPVDQSGFVSALYAQALANPSDLNINIDLDHALIDSSDMLSILQNWNNGINNGLLLSIDDAGSAAAFLRFDDVMTDISLEIATKTNPTITTTTEVVTIDQGNSCACFSASTAGSVSIPLLQVANNLPADAILLNVEASITASSSGGYLSVGFASGAIDDFQLPSSGGTCDDTTNFILRSKYSHQEGGYPGFDPSSTHSMFMLFDGQQICFSSVVLTFEYITTPSTPCAPQQQTSPSPTPFVSPSVFITSTSPPLPSTVATPSNAAPLSPTPLRSADMAPPVPVETKSPAPSTPQAISPSRMAEISATPSRTPSRNPAIQQTPVVVPTTIPAVPGPIPISDEDGNVVVVVDLGSGNDNENLVVTPVDLVQNVRGARSVESLLVSLVLLDSFGFEVQPGSPVKICIEAPQASTENSCLGFLDESANPARWRCEDSCLEQDQEGLLCGRTSHFTSFAVLLGGTNSGCASSADLIFDEAWQDGILIASVSLCIICCLLIVAVFLAATKTGSRIVRGGEGYRIANLRKSTLEHTVVEV